MAPLRPGERDAVVDAALDAMDAPHLRELIRALIPWLDDATQARLMNEVVDRAARASSGWIPATPSDRREEEIEAFAAAARRVHQADPSTRGAASTTSGAGRPTRTSRMRRWSNALRSTPASTELMETRRSLPSLVRAATPTHRATSATGSPV